jgi:hypothetical protein
MSRITLSSKLLDVDVECNFLTELGDLMSDTFLSLEKGWYAKIEMKPHPQAKTDIMYSIRYAPKKRIITIIEKFRGRKYEHPVDVLDEFEEMVPVQFITEFLEGLPSATEYI